MELVFRFQKPGNNTRIFENMSKGYPFAILGTDITDIVGRNRVDIAINIRNFDYAFLTLCEDAKYLDKRADGTRTKIKTASVKSFFVIGADIFRVFLKKITAINSNNRFLVGIYNKDKDHYNIKILDNAGVTIYDLTKYKIHNEEDVSILLNIINSTEYYDPNTSILGYKFSSVYKYFPESLFMFGARFAKQWYEYTGFRAPWVNSSASAFVSTKDSEIFEGSK